MLDHFFGGEEGPLSERLQRFSEMAEKVKWLNQEERRRPRKRMNDKKFLIWITTSLISNFQE
jgi:hypothetical protein